MPGSTEQPKVFISYSWTSPQHERWVLDLAERLVGDGVLVVLDKWDLKEGQDKHVFMEQMVGDEKITKVLVVCDQGYQAKADGRKGGVGTETQLISKEVYENTGQEKFIPIIKEYNADGKPCVPHYMASRIYIDLSSDGIFEENYEKLLRNLYGKPSLKKPPLGTPPAYLSQEQPVLGTSHKVAEIKNALIADKKSANGLIDDYLETFAKNLLEFRINGGTQPDFDEKVLESIEKMLPLRNDFLDFTDVVFKYSAEPDLNKFHAFWEKLVQNIFRPAEVNTFTEIDFDNYKFFNYELFLYFIATLLQLKKYAAVAFFINSQYFFRDPTSGTLHYDDVGIFNQYVRSLDDIRKQRLKLNRISLTADLLKQRAVNGKIKFNDIIDADILLFYLTELNTPAGAAWFPRTSIYNEWRGHMELLQRMISRKHFEMVKALFAVETVDQLKKKILEYLAAVQAQTKRTYHFDTFHHSIPSIKEAVPLDKLCTVS